MAVLVKRVSNILISLKSHLKGGEKTHSMFTGCGLLLMCDNFDNTELLSYVMNSK